MITREEAAALKRGDVAYKLHETGRIITLNVWEEARADGTVRWQQGWAMLRDSNRHAFFLKREDAVATRKADKLLSQ